MHLISKLLTILAVFLAILPSIIVYSQPVLMQGGDYLMTFYPAGKLAVLGRIADIYTPIGMDTFIGAPFDKFIHATFPAVPANYVAIYMYSPLIALFFGPFSYLPAALSLIVWQLINVVVALFSALMFARQKIVDKILDLSVIFLFCPIFHTLLIGQLGILFGLLPLAISYKLLLKRREFLAGLILGTLYMKPQFMPCALLVCGALFMVKRVKATLGFVCGLMAMIALTALLTGPDMVLAFWQSIKMSDSCYSVASYNPPLWLVTCLPAVILQCFDVSMRDALKLPVYGLAAVIGLAALWHCIKLWRQVPFKETDGDADRVYARATSITFLIGLFVLPLVVPHFLFYDLCGLALLAFMVHSDIFSSYEQKYLQVLRRYTWWACNLYYLSFSFIANTLGPWFPMVLVALLSVVLYRIKTLKLAVDNGPMGAGKG